MPSSTLVAHRASKLMVVLVLAGAVLIASVMFARTAMHATRTWHEVTANVVPVPGGLEATWSLDNATHTGHVTSQSTAAGTRSVWVTADGSRVRATSPFTAVRNGFLRVLVVTAMFILAAFWAIDGIRLRRFRAHPRLA